MKKFLFAFAAVIFLAHAGYADTTRDMSNENTVELNMNSDQISGGGSDNTVGSESLVDTNGDGVINADDNTSADPVDTGTATDTCDDNDAGTGCPAPADESGISGTPDASRNTLGAIGTRQSGSNVAPEDAAGTTGTTDSSRASLGTMGVRQSGTGEPTDSKGQTITEDTTIPAPSDTATDTPATGAADSSRNSLGTMGARQSGTGGPTNAQGH